MFSNFKRYTVLTITPLILFSGKQIAEIHGSEIGFYKLLPSTGMETFDVKVKDRSFVSLKIKDMNGREVHGYNLGYKEPGTYYSDFAMEYEGEKISGLFEVELYEDGSKKSKKTIYIPSEYTEIYDDGTESFGDLELGEVEEEMYND
ncbi:MAG: hypothetical protein JXR48_05815 [Candidatus Delongbacteria bacterium]|nr:hypothetical protein [Candidatus Delongbacteria bacterium]MBN2834467.1 hypothetical protein [Candidatus Delongbacteria bacterium]